MELENKEGEQRSSREERSACYSGIAAHAVIMKHSDQDLLEWVEAGGRACLTGYTELGSLSHANLSIGKPSFYVRW